MTPRQTIAETIHVYRVAMRETDEKSQAKFIDLGQTLGLFAAVQCLAFGLAATFAALGAYNVPQAIGRLVAAVYSDGWLSTSYVASAGDSVGAAAGWGFLAWACAKGYRAACFHADVVKGDAAS